MSVDVLERIREELAELRRMVELQRLEAGPLTLSYERASKQLGVSERTLRRMVARKELVTVTVGKTPMVPASELRRLVSSAPPLRPSREAARAVAKASPKLKPRRSASMPEGSSSSEVAKLRALRKARR